VRKMRLVLSGLAILTTGCSHPGLYWQNRALDFADCFRGEVGTGYGLDVQVGATDWLATGIGVSWTHMVGFVGRHPIGPGYDNDGNAHLGFPAAQIVVAIVPQCAGGLCCCPLVSPFPDAQQRNAPPEKQAGALQRMAKQLELQWLAEEEPADNCSPLYREALSNCGLNLTALDEKNRGHGGLAPGPKLVDAFEVDIGSTLGVISARVGFSFGQFADYALGFFGLDIAGDDAE